MIGVETFDDCEIINGAYKEIEWGGAKYRLFGEFSDEEMLTWHIDGVRRIVRVHINDGWHFQYDDEIPIELIESQELDIGAEQFHRVMKGHGYLLISIFEII